MPSKQCSKCKEVKPVSEFGKKKSTKDGLQCQCRECRLVAAREYRKSENGIIARNRYNQSEKAKLYVKRYNKSERRRIAARQHSITGKGKASRAWSNFRRRDELLEYHRRRYLIKKLGPNFKSTNNAEINYTSTSFIGRE